MAANWRCLHAVRQHASISERRELLNRTPYIGGRENYEGQVIVSAGTATEWQPIHICPSKNPKIAWAGRDSNPS